MSAIKCNGVAWGVECPQRANCANHIDPEQWRADVKTGMPNAREFDSGYRLLACDQTRLQFFVPITPAPASLADAQTMDLFS
jgi:hypothetical protein